jgi:hypothetical protein
MPRQPLPAFADEFVDENRASEILDLAVPSLQKDRVQNRLGIPHYRFGRLIKYRVSELVAWAEARRVVLPAVNRAPVADDEDPDDVLVDRPARRGRPRQRFAPVQEHR